MAIFREHTSFDNGCQEVLSNYLPPDDPELLAREQDEDTVRTFPQFMLLPPEIREKIWELAIPRRNFDLRETRYLGTYTEIRNYLPPVPHIAHVCREARDVVMRLGIRLYYAWIDQFRNNPWSDNPSGERWSDDSRGDNSRIKVTPIGFFIKGRDIVLHMPDPSSRPDLNLSDVIRSSSRPMPLASLWQH